MKAGLIIVAGGISRRFGGSVKKQFVTLGNVPIFLRTLQVFSGITEIAERVVVLPASEIDEIQNKFVAELSEVKVDKLVAGGKERVNSVIQGFNALSAECETIIIHDAVRPFVSQEIILNTMKTAEEFGAAIVAVPVKDTLKSVDENLQITKTADRSKLYSAQTPQIFSRKLFENSIKNWQELDEPEVTDDAMLVELLGEKVNISNGSYLNIKVTQPEDILLAQAIFEVFTSR